MYGSIDNKMSLSFSSSIRRKMGSADIRDNLDGCCMETNLTVIISNSNAVMQYIL